MCNLLVWAIHDSRQDLNLQLMANTLIEVNIKLTLHSFIIIIIMKIVEFQLHGLQPYIYEYS